MSNIIQIDRLYYIPIYNNGRTKHACIYTIYVFDMRVVHNNNHNDDDDDGHLLI